jgi:hypothetical protein
VHHKHKKHHQRADSQQVSMLQSGASTGVGAELLKRREHALQRDKNVEHKVMSDFMNRFSLNMRAAVLDDSKGDLPEATRQKLL